MSPQRFGRTLHPEEDYENTIFARPDLARRRVVLRQTLARLATPTARDRLARIATENVRRWAAAATPQPAGVVEVRQGDWGVVAGDLTREHGTVFAVLNMANAHVAGGGYTEGSPAQEENMFRRTDCHFHVDEQEFDQRLDRYQPHMTDRLNAADGRVYLDVEHPRICVRGAEDRQRTDLGYPWLAEDAVFPFYELRASAVDLRTGVSFDRAEALHRIEAQLDTLIDHRIRHAILSAFGCGAFLNPADVVASCYRCAIESRREHFDCVVFAIFYPGYGADNLQPFQEVFDRDGAQPEARGSMCKELGS